MNRIVIGFILFFCLAVPTLGATKKIQASSSQADPLVEAYIKYEQTSWQNYDFSVATNLPPTELKYEWTIDEKEIYETEALKVFLNQGEHVVKVRVEDKFGNVVYDNVKLDIQFWSLHNNWVWWLVYLLVVCIIVYYWFVKIVYLLNRKKVSKQVREFMDLLNDYGWIERIIEAQVMTTKSKRIKNKS